MAPDSQPAPAVSSEAVLAEIVPVLGLVLDLDEEHKLYHAWRVAALATRFGEHIIPDRSGFLYYAGLLHDIGGVGMKDHLVHAIMREEMTSEVLTHPLRGAHILAAFPFFRPVEAIVAQHHERYDGSGYPRGLRGEEISAEAYLLQSADHLEIALRKAPSPPDETALIQACSNACSGLPSFLAEQVESLISESPSDYVGLFEDEQLELAVRAFIPRGLPLEDFTPSQVVEAFAWLFAQVIDSKHTYTLGHSIRVAYFASEIVLALGGDTALQRNAVLAGLLHDIGKVGVPRFILDKPGGLTAQERARIQQHTLNSYQILSGVSSLSHLASPAVAHHECWDGSGYPYGLKGDAIPFLGRLLAFADRFDAMSSLRSYRRAMSKEEVLNILRGEVGTALDPTLADPVLSVLARLAPIHYPTQVGVFPESMGPLRFRNGVASWSEG